MGEATNVLSARGERKIRRERGAGSIFKPRFKDKDGETCECPHWRISYFRHGRRYVENTHSDKITVAKELLKKKLGEIAAGNFTPPSTEKVLVDDLMDELLRDYRVREVSSIGSGDNDPDIEYIRQKAKGV
jgi:hypothetical protein